MSYERRIETALISVYHKNGLDQIVQQLSGLGIKIISTGGTFEYIASRGFKVFRVEDITTYPSILGGRVKTLHPRIFGGILFRREHKGDLEEVLKYEIPPVDLVVVDLYPFEKTVEETNKEEEIIEKIDIGGISLIRAAAKNYRDVVVVASMEQYRPLITLLEEKEGYTSLEDRRLFAARAFSVSSDYDTAIFNYFNRGLHLDVFRKSYDEATVLRYGENPHQRGVFYGDIGNIFNKLHGKELSYNNLVDLDAGLQLIAEFEEPTFAILKHNNACGLASRESLTDAWKDALAGDPVSAFGGVIITNKPIDEATAKEMDQLFFEIVAAPSYQKNALETLRSRKNRIILELKTIGFTGRIFKSVLNGILEQDRDGKTETIGDLRPVTLKTPDGREAQDLIFANKIVKHTKSNTIVLAKDRQLVGSGTGQTSRVDALKQAITKARSFDFDLKGAVMASDAFFPFADSVEIAHEAGITAVLQPGGSVRDQESIDFCNSHGMSMVFTGTRHFRH